MLRPGSNRRASSRAARSSAVANSRSPSSGARSKGVSQTSSQIPSRSGCPHSVLPISCPAAGAAASWKTTTTAASAIATRNESSSRRCMSRPPRMPLGNPRTRRGPCGKVDPTIIVRGYPVGQRPSVCAARCAPSVQWLGVHSQHPCRSSSTSTPSNGASGAPPTRYARTRSTPATSTSCRSWAYREGNVLDCSIEDTSERKRQTKFDAGELTWILGIASLAGGRWTSGRRRLDRRGRVDKARPV